MSVGHQSPKSTLPPLNLKTLNTTTWGAGGNTTTITDPYLTGTNSLILVQVTGTTPQAGQWAYAYAEGSVTITSTDSESSTLPLTYGIY